MSTRGRAMRDRATRAQTERGSAVDRTVNSAMLTLARESWGWSQKELADRLGVTQATVSKYENGLLQVSEQDAAEIARVLGYTPELLYQRDQVYGLGSSFLFHRRRATAPVALQRKVQARINILRMQVERLLRGVETNFVNSFDVVDAGEVDAEPEKAARIVRAAWRVPFGPVPNVTTAIENAGGIVLKCTFETDLIDAAHFWLPGLPPMFFVNRDIPGDRMRWTLAHEIGHAILHRNYAGADVEDEADRFASEFLLPREEIARHLHGLNLEQAAVLKQHWKVSIAALVRQAHRLDCITPTKYKNLNASLSSQGYRKNEPYPIPVEEPGLLRAIVNTHRTKLGYSDADLARLLFSPDPQFFEPGLEPRVLRIDGQPFFAFFPERVGPRRLSPA